jgi:hypothetical protein
MTKARKNRCWLDDLGRRHPVGKRFHAEVREMLEGHGLLEEPIPDGVRGVVEETYRREQDRTETYAECVRALRDWQRDLEQVTETLRETRRMLALAGDRAEADRTPGAEGPRKKGDVPIVAGTRSIH